MPQRYTIRELKEYSDYEFILRLIQDRKQTCTNIYSPLFKRLNDLQNKLDNQKPLTKPFRVIE